MIRNKGATLVVTWLLAAATADFGKQQQTENEPFQPSTMAKAGIPIMISPITNNKANFKYKGKVVTKMDVADLVIIYDQTAIHNVSKVIINDIIYLRDIIDDDKFIASAIRETQRATEEMLNHDQLVEALEKRALWGQMMLVTSLIGTGLSAAALVSAHANKNQIRKLEQETSRIFKVHEHTLNEHSNQINLLAEKTRRVMSEMNLVQRSLVKIELANHIRQFRRAVRQRTRLLEDLLTGQVPLNILDAGILEATSEMLTRVNNEGQKTFPGFKPIEIINLPYSVGDLGHGRFHVHFHLPIFNNPDTDIMDVFQIQRTPWILKSKKGIKFIAVPTPADDYDSIIVPIEHQASGIHQITRLETITKCPTFRNIRLCTPDGIFSTDMTSSCIGSLYRLDNDNIKKNCPLKQPQHEQKVFLTSINNYTIAVYEKEKITTKNVDEPNSKTRILEPGLYHVSIPFGSWIRTTNALIRPTFIHEVEHYDINGEVSTSGVDINLAETHLKPFSEDDINKVKQIKNEQLANNGNLLHENVNDSLTIIAVIISTVLLTIIVGFCVHVYRAQNCARMAQRSEPSD